MKSLWHWTRSQIFKRLQRRIRHSPCVLGKLSVKSLSMNGMALLTFLSCSIFTMEKCEVVVWIKMIANIFVKALPALLQPFYSFRRVHLIWDGGPSHASAATASFLKSSLWLMAKNFIYACTCFLAQSSRNLVEKF